MRTNLAYRNVETNTGVPQTMTIKAGGKAFKVIIDGMYSNKAESITREIWSNAYDAHRMSGRLDKPFKVTFPTSFDSSFRCRDYGPGMSHAFMVDSKNGYSVAFNSTKEDTNEAVGFLGIGRLSPFSYTDTYSVTCWDGQEVRYYSVFLMPDGSPCVPVLMGREPSTEPSGTEISFAVERVDRSAFRDAAMKVSLAFDVKPECTQSDFEGWPEIPVHIQGEGWVHYKHSHDYSHPLYGHQSYARMGCVLYPLNSDLFDYGSDEYQLLSSGRFIIDFDIGDLAVTASRENLSFGRNEPTRDSIVRKVSEICSEIEATYLAMIAMQPNLWQAKEALGKATALPRSVTKSVQNNAMWQNERLTSTSLDVPVGVRVSPQSAYEFRRRKTIQWNSRGVILCDNTPTIVIEELQQGKRDVRGPTRISQWFGNLTDKPQTVLWFKVDDDNRQQTMDWIAEVADHLEIVYVKDMYDPGVNRSGSTTRSKTMVKEYMGPDSYDNVELTDEEFKAGGVYMRISNNSFVEGQGGYAKVYSGLYAAGKITDRMIVVPKTYWTKFQNADQWVELYDLANEYLNEVGVGYLNRIAHRSDRKDYRDQFMPDTDTSTVIDVYNRYLSSATERDPIANITPDGAYKLLLGLGKYQFSRSRETAQKLTVKRLRQACIDRYPLLEYTVHGCSDADIRHWKKYIELMDKENENV